MTSFTADGANVRRRRSVHLRGYDYATPGAYFVTICTQGRACVFGDVVDAVMRPNDAGRMVETVWREIPGFYPGVDVDEFAIMPNHIHGIIVLVGATPCGRPDTGQAQGPVIGQAQGPAPTVLTLADIVRRFKTMTTKRYADRVRGSGWPPFDGRLWQRNYYERVIRDEDELNRFRRYVADNPERWETDDGGLVNVVDFTAARGTGARFDDPAHGIGTDCKLVSEHWNGVQ